MTVSVLVFSEQKKYAGTIRWRRDDGSFYDLILLDTEIPGTSGIEILQQVKGFLPNVRIIS